MVLGRLLSKDEPENSSGKYVCVYYKILVWSASLSRCDLSVYIMGFETDAILWIQWDIKFWLSPSITTKDVSRMVAFTHRRLTLSLLLKHFCGPFLYTTLNARQENQTINHEAVNNKTHHTQTIV